jgi:hypothetical protein
MTQMDHFLPISSAPPCGKGAREGIRKSEMCSGVSVKVVGDYSMIDCSEGLTPKTFSSNWLSLL